jgi:hypothetical protein
MFDILTQKHYESDLIRPEFETPSEKRIIVIYHHQLYQKRMAKGLQ